MDKRSGFERTGVLQEGKRYFLRSAGSQLGIPVFTLITFIGYTACPAMVVVENGRRERMRCSRMELFAIM